MNTTPRRNLLISGPCLKDFEKYSQYKRSYDKVLLQLHTHPQNQARHAIHGQSGRLQVFESTVSDDLRLCWSYGTYVGEPVILL